MKNFLFALIWLALLIFIAWPIAGICAFFWLILQVRVSLPGTCMRCCKMTLRPDPHSCLSLLLYINLLVMTKTHPWQICNRPLKESFPLSDKSMPFWKRLSHGPVNVVMVRSNPSDHALYTS